MTDNMRRFLENISSNEEDRKKVCSLASNEEIIAFAKEKDFTLTDEDFEKADGELSNDELEAVSGGVEICGCVAAGASQSDKVVDLLMCVGMGSGLDTMFCICIIVGISWS